MSETNVLPGSLVPPETSWQKWVRLNHIFLGEWPKDLRYAFCVLDGEKVEIFGHPEDVGGGRNFQVVHIDRKPNDRALLKGLPFSKELGQGLAHLGYPNLMEGGPYWFLLSKLEGHNYEYVSHSFTLQEAEEAKKELDIKNPPPKQSIIGVYWFTDIRPFNGKPCMFVSPPTGPDCAGKSWKFIVPYA